MVGLVFLALVLIWLQETVIIRMMRQHKTVKCPVCKKHELVLMYVLRCRSNKYETDRKQET